MIHVLGQELAVKLSHVNDEFYTFIYTALILSFA